MTIYLAKRKCEYCGQLTWHQVYEGAAQIQAVCSKCGEPSVDRKEKGFTLIELMLVISMVSILGAIVMPKISGLVNRARDAQTLGNLGTLRSALSIYYVDNNGVYPGFPTPFSQPAGYGDLLQETLVPHYLSKIPMASPHRHTASSSVYLVWNLSGDHDNHGWVYDANPFDGLKPEEVKGMWGTVRVLCTHENSKGVNWSNY